MKNNPVVELVFLIILAFLLSSILYAVLAFVLSMMNVFDTTAKINLSNVTGVFAGLIIGYRLRDMVRNPSKTKKKRK